MMEPELLAILKEAQKTRRSKESFESALGRAVRDRGKDFSVYVQMMGEIRELALHRKQDVDDVVRSLISGSEDQSK